MYFNVALNDILPPLARFAPPETPTKAAPYTMAHFIGWLMSHHPDEKYDWLDGQNCLLAQYERSISCMSSPVPYEAARWRFGKMLGQPREYELTTMVAKDGVWTFGAALGRAKKLEATWQS
jgi:hypothetical protein